MKPLAAFVLLATCAVAAEPAAQPAPQITFAEIPTPAGPNALGASLTVAPDGTHWLSWVEAGAPLAATASSSATASTVASSTEASTSSASTAAPHHRGAAPAADAPPNTLRFATFDAAGKKWSEPRTIFRGPSVTTNAADFPQLAVDGRDHVTALWASGGSAFTTTSADRGATWSPPATWTTESDVVEKFSLATLADGRVLAAWLDGRGIKAGGKTQQLYARILGQTGPDMLVDPSVCECCQTTLTAFLDGTALVAYRGRTEQEVRDIRTARFDGQAWSTPRPLNHDEWQILACPINGPRLASDGGRVAAAWFTGAANAPRVLASYSPDAGTRFLLPLTIARGQPVGHVDTAILHDGAMLVTWVEGDGSFWLRRVTPEFTLSPPVALAPAGTVSLKTNPRLSLLRDYAGGTEPAQLLVTFATAASALRTLLVTIPEGELLVAEKNCDCAPTAEQLQGFPMRGQIVEVRSDAGLLRVQHSTLPGLFAGGTRDFQVDPETLAALQPGRQFLGRIERRDGTWRLFDIRLLALPPAAK